MDLLGSDKQFKVESLALAELTKIRQILNQRSLNSKGELADHYRYLLKKIEMTLK